MEKSLATVWQKFAVRLFSAKRNFSYTIFPHFPTFSLSIMKNWLRPCWHTNPPVASTGYRSGYRCSVHCSNHPPKQIVQYPPAYQHIGHMIWPYYSQSQFGSNLLVRYRQALSFYRLNSNENAMNAVSFGDRQFYAANRPKQFANRARTVALKESKRRMAIGLWIVRMERSLDERP